MGTTQSDTSVACTLERLFSIWFENNSFSNSLYFEKKTQYLYFIRATLVLLRPISNLPKTLLMNIFVSSKSWLDNEAEESTMKAISRLFFWEQPEERIWGKIMNKSKWEWKIGNDDFDELCKDTKELPICCRVCRWRCLWRHIGL